MRPRTDEKRSSKLSGSSKESSELRLSAHRRLPFLWRISVRVLRPFGSQDTIKAVFYVRMRNRSTGSHLMLLKPPPQCWLSLKLQLCKLAAPVAVGSRWMGEAHTTALRIELSGVYYRLHRITGSFSQRDN